MSRDDYFWKAFETTGSPQIYLMYKNNKNHNNDDEREKRNANF